MEQTFEPMRESNQQPATSQAVPSNLYAFTFYYLLHLLLFSAYYEEKVFTIQSNLKRSNSSLHKTKLCRAIFSKTAFKLVYQLTEHFNSRQSFTLRMSEEQSFYPTATIYQGYMYPNQSQLITVHACMSVCMSVLSGY